MESRLAYRYKKKLGIDIQVNKKFQAAMPALQDRILKAEIYDISVNGIGMLSDYYFPSGIILNIILGKKHFGWKKDLRLKGILRYSKSVLFFDHEKSPNKNNQARKQIKRSAYHCGVKFLDITPGQKKLIKDFIAESERRKRARLKIAE